MDKAKQSIKNKLVFVPGGQLGNAIFRYFACAMINIINPSLEYTLSADARLPSDNLIYYAGLDHVGDDLCYSNDPNDREKAFENNNILGYNTLGYFKHTIDLENLTSNMYVNKENGEGLYVKNNIILNDENFFNHFYKNLEYFNILVDGFFQFGYIYLKYKAQILDYCALHKNAHFIRTNENQQFLMRDIIDDLVLPPEKHYDIVIHLDQSKFIDFEPLLDLFQEKKICLIYQDARDTAPITQWFQAHNIPLSIESNTLLMDFNIMKQAAILICSMSPLSWAAAYLSTHIQTCYMPDYNFYGTEQEHIYFHKPIANTLFYSVKSRIKPYILTLPEYPTRLEKLNNLNRQLSLIGHEADIYYGVNGREIEIFEAASAVTHIKHITWRGTTYFYDRRTRLNGEPMTRGEFGCAWSHLNLLRQLVADETGTDYYLIFEDDLELVRPLNELHELLNHIPADADICHLAQSLWNPFVLQAQVNAYFYECEKGFFNSTIAYLISRKGAQKVLAYAKNSINLPIDDLFNTVYHANSDFRFYVPSDPFFKEQANAFSTIGAVDHF